MAFLKRNNPTTSSTGTSGRRFGAAKLASGIPLILLALAAWAVTLAGVAIVRHEDGENTALADLSFTWFVVFGALFVLLFSLVSIVGDSLTFLPSGHAAISGLLAVMTTLTILQTQVWNTARKNAGPKYQSKLSKGAVTAFSGFLSLSVLMSILIMVLGSQANRRNLTHHHNEEYVHPVQPVGTVPVHNTGVQPVV